MAKKASTPSFVLDLKLNTDQNNVDFLVKRFHYSQKLHNALVRYVKKQIAKLQQDHAYKVLMKEWHATKKSKVPAMKKRHTEINLQLAELRRYYGLHDKYQLEVIAANLRHSYSKYIHSQQAQLIAADVWRAVEKYLYGNGKYIHFKKYHEMDSLHGTKNNTGIWFNGRYLIFGTEKTGYKIPVMIDENDFYVIQALQHRIKFVRVKRMAYPNGYHYYLQLVLEGIPPKKPALGYGRVGIDIGTSTVAAVSHNKCILDELNHGTKDYTKEITRIQRAMDRSKRATNPNKYHEDGTIKKGNRDKWVFSKGYKQLQMRKRMLERKQALSLKQSHETLANRILMMGDDIYVEDMDFKALQRRAKQTTKNKKGKFNRKGRFGKSIKQHAPAMLISIVERKLQYYGKEIHKVDTKSFRASQYNHITDDYVKKKLHNRYVNLNGRRIQRDLYSAFLLMNSVPCLTHTDRELCICNYERFLKKHDRCIGKLIQSGDKYPSYMGLKHFVAH